MIPLPPRKSWPSTDDARPVGQGCFGVVYQLDESIAVKVYKSYQSRFRIFTMLRRELAVCTFLHDAGVRVPRPHGIYNVDFGIRDQDRRVQGAGFVMQYIQGYGHSDICNRASSNVPSLMQLESLIVRELNKCRALDITPSKDAHGNFVYVPEEDAVYLVDFHGWESPSWLTRTLRKLRA